MRTDRAQVQVTSLLLLVDYARAGLCDSSKLEPKQGCSFHRLREYPSLSQYLVLSNVLLNIFGYLFTSVSHS